MIVYEVNVEVDDEIFEEYLAWLNRHVVEILALPGFAAAEVFAADPKDPSPVVGLCVQYRLHDRAALDTYLVEHAPRLRAEAEARFGGRFTASRRVLEPITAPRCAMRSGKPPRG